MANILPNLDINFPGTPRLLAKLFFRTVLDSVRFRTEKGNSALPLSFIYLDALYWEKGKPFLFNNELLKFSPAEVNCLDPKDYRQLYKEILQLGGIIESDEYKPSENTSDAFALAYSDFKLGYNFKLPEASLERLGKNIIDQLDLPALENSLNEAVRIENYEAAAHIRNKIEAEAHAIIEYKGRLKIKKLSKNPPAPVKKSPDCL